jgi:hypothetical protein
MRIAPRILIAAAAVSLITLALACTGKSHSAPVEETATFEVTLVNLTAGQPLSPMVVIAHNDGFTAFAVGQPASIALEHLAEGGESAPLLALANDSKSVYATAVGVGGPLVPGPSNKSTVTLTVPVSSLPMLRLSLACMLGNTNDGFTGISGQALSTLAIGATFTSNLLSYDAGTEAHTESGDTVPGPATASSGGKREAFNPVRNDEVDAVRLHPGIVGKDDGLPSSALTQANRWDNPVASLMVKRLQ